MGLETEGVKEQAQKPKPKPGASFSPQFATVSPPNQKKREAALSGGYKPVEESLEVALREPDPKSDAVETLGLTSHRTA